MKNYTLILILSSIIIVGCTGENGSLQPLQAPEVFSAKGQSVDGLLINADIKIYSIDNVGNKKRLLGEGRTDNKGNFNITNIIKNPQSIFIEACNGYYREEATGETRYLNSNECLTSYDNIGEQPQHRHYTVSGFTHMAVAYTRYHVKKSKNISQAIDLGRLAMTAIMGGVDPHRTKYYDITSNDSKGHDFLKNTDGFMYSVIVVGVSELAKSKSSGISKVFSITYWQLLYEDIINDGLIDGVGRDGKLSFGGEVLHPNQIRSRATRLGYQFVNDGRAKITVNSESKKRLYTKLLKINVNNHILYNHQAIKPMDNTAPQLQWDSTYRGGAFTLATYTLTFSEENRLKSVIASITDSRGQIRPVFSVQDRDALGRYIQKGNRISFPLRYKDYATGNAILTVSIVDEYNNSKTSSTSLYFVNDKPSVTFSTAATYVSSATLFVKGFYTLSSDKVGIKSLVFQWDDQGKSQSKVATINKSSRTWTISLRANPGINGIVVFNVVVCDSINNCHTQQYTAKVDNQVPVIEHEKTITKINIYSSLENKVKAVNLLINSLKRGLGDNNNYPPTSYTYPLILHYDYGRHTQGMIAGSIDSLNAARIPYISFNYLDPTNPMSYQSPYSKLRIGVEYSTSILSTLSYLNKNQQVNTQLNTVFKRSVSPSRTFINPSGTRYIVFPLTTESLGQQFKNTSPNIAHVLKFLVCDEANNCSFKAYTFQAMFEAPSTKNLSFSKVEPNDITRSIIAKPYSRRSSIFGSRIHLHESRFRNIETKAIYIRPIVSSQQFKIERNYRIREVTNRWQRYERTAQCVTDNNYPIYIGVAIAKISYLNQHKQPPIHTKMITCSESYWVINGCSRYIGGGDNQAYNCYKTRNVSRQYESAFYSLVGTHITDSTSTDVVKLTTQQFFVYDDFGELTPLLDGYYQIQPQRRVTIKTEGLVQPAFIYQDYQAISTRDVSIGNWKHDTRAHLSYKPVTSMHLVFSDGSANRPSLTPKVLTVEGSRLEYIEGRE